MTDSRQPLNPDALRLEPAQGGLASYPAVEKWEDWVEYDRYNLFRQLGL